MSRYIKKGQRIGNLISNADIAIDNEFFLEGTTICFAIIEERLRSVLEKVYNRPLGEKHKIDSCIERIIKEQKNENNSLLKLYIPKDFLNEILVWKNERNNLMHELINKGFDPEYLRINAQKGRELMSKLNTSVMKWKKKWLKESK